MKKARPVRIWVMAAAASLLAGGAIGEPPPTYPSDYTLKPFAFPKPGGRYAIGSRAFTMTVAGAGALHVVAWYPAAAASGPAAPYLDPAEQRVQAPAIARNFGWPADALRDIARLPTHAHDGAEIARGRFPLLIFSHGYMSYPRENSALMERLAARGYIILSLAHPGDAADIPMANGVIATVPAAGQKQPDTTALNAFWEGRDDTARMRARAPFWRALRGGRLLNSLDRWRADIERLTDAVDNGHVPGEARSIADAVDKRRIAFFGWSFGGSSSASACQIDRRCRAAINMDGFEFDSHLYDRRTRMPLMLIQSDWSAFPNMGPPSNDYTIYDYAYEPWRSAGSASTVYRFRINGVRHLGLTDLVMAPRDPIRDRMFGPADGNVVTDEVASLVEAFFDRYVKGEHAEVAAVAARYPGVTRHDASEIAHWHHGRHRP